MEPKHSVGRVVKSYKLESLASIVIRAYLVRFHVTWNYFFTLDEEIRMIPTLFIP